MDITPINSNFNNVYFKDSKDSEKNNPNLESLIWKTKLDQMSPTHNGVARPSYHHCDQKQNTNW